VPLPAPVPREELHLRRIELRGYRRHDGLYEIEAHLTDSKPQAAPLHDMWIRLVIDDELTVHDIVASTDASPYAACPEAVDTLAQLKGLRIGRGFGRIVRERLSGVQGCTHLTELLVPLATTAFQTLSDLRNARPDRLDANGKPVKIDSCYAYASTRELVRMRWPDFSK
jgi:hypothetical protein